MRNNYVTPVAKIYLCTEDVITTSVTVMGDDNVVSWGAATSQEVFGE